MHRYLLLLSFLFTLLLCSCQGSAQPQNQPEFAARKTALEASRQRADYDSLHFLLATQYTQLSAEARRTLRITLEKQAVWPYEFICPPTEPGIHIVLQGRLYDEKQQPIAGAKLHIFQTDNQGYYSPLDASTGRMLENDPRLEGFLSTDSLGRFNIQTIRPASYPVKYEGRLIPQHIHVIVTAEGFRDGIFQVVFEDDPAMQTEHWQAWALKGKHPVVKPDYSGKEIRAELELTLNR